MERNGDFPSGREISGRSRVGAESNDVIGDFRRERCQFLRGTGRILGFRTSVAGHESEAVTLLCERADSSLGVASCKTG